MEDIFANIRNTFGLDSFNDLCEKVSGALIGARGEITYQSILSAINSERITQLEKFPNVDFILPIENLIKLSKHNVVIECIEVGGVLGQKNFSLNYFSVFWPKSKLEDLRAAAFENDHLQFYFMDAQTEKEYRLKELAAQKGEKIELDMNLRKPKLISVNAEHNYVNYMLHYFPLDAIGKLGPAFFEEFTKDYIIVKISYDKPLRKIRDLILFIENLL